jgi:hypothetical protein
MKLSAIIAEVRKAVEPWIMENGGTLVVARDPWHAYELIANGPNGMTLVLGYAGRSIIDGHRGNPLGQPRIELILGNGMGLDVETGSSALQQIGDRAPLVDLIDALVQIVCDIKMSEVSAKTTSPCFEFTGDDPVELPNGLRLAAYRLNFQIAAIVLETPQAV